MNYFTHLTSIFDRTTIIPLAEDPIPHQAMTPAGVTSSSPPASSAPSSQIPGLMTMAEWEADKSLRITDASSQPAQKKQKLHDSAAPRTPLPSKPRGDYAAKLNDLCQSHRLRAQFDSEEGPPYAFSAGLIFFDGLEEVRHFATESTFPSKKAAKEKVAEMGLLWLEAKSLPPKLSKSTDLLPLEAEKIDMSENWVGVLHEFCQSSHREQPEYTFYQLGSQRYGATCTILGSIYHDRDAAFASKKMAKTAAARSTVITLRDKGVLSKPSSIKRSAATNVSSTPTFTLPITASATLPTEGIKENVSPSQSPAASALVPPLCATLGMSPPLYDFTPSSSITPNFWDGAAYFKNTTEPVLRGAVAKVEKVYGQKKAKEQIAARVLQLLERIRDERLAS